ncbi:hypothetical protein DPMN_114553 [Dreissena polymorpha]|uniref:Secreted protein n=1 Tax=Dreissena polymorpha TaxID=45954 RepID=A0A9D4QRN5_DREPO|nr:hypothetical protein DPMN_114553 [Dreissena polymorpha]
MYVFFFSLAQVFVGDADACRSTCERDGDLDLHLELFSLGCWCFSSDADAFETWKAHVYNTFCLGWHFDVDGTQDYTFEICLLKNGIIED